jgi:hypothetical protein
MNVVKFAPNVLKNVENISRIIANAVQPCAGNVPRRAVSNKIRKQRKKAVQFFRKNHQKIWNELDKNNIFGQQQQHFE